MGGNFWPYRWEGGLLVFQLELSSIKVLDGVCHICVGCYLLHICCVLCAIYVLGAVCHIGVIWVTCTFCVLGNIFQIPIRC